MNKSDSVVPKVGAGAAGAKDCGIEPGESSGGGGGESAAVRLHGNGAVRGLVSTETRMDGRSNGKGAELPSVGLEQSFCRPEKTSPKESTKKLAYLHHFGCFFFKM